MRVMIRNKTTRGTKIFLKDMILEEIRIEFERLWIQTGYDAGK